MHAHEQAQAHVHAHAHHAHAHAHAPGPMIFPMADWGMVSVVIFGTVCVRAPMRL
jgi:hypothetical protein